MGWMRRATSRKALRRLEFNLEIAMKTVLSGLRIARFNPPGETALPDPLDSGSGNGCRTTSGGTSTPFAEAHPFQARPGFGSWVRNREQANTPAASIKLTGASTRKYSLVFSV